MLTNDDRVNTKIKLNL